MLLKKKLSRVRPKFDYKKTKMRMVYKQKTKQKRNKHFEKLYNDHKQKQARRLKKQAGFLKLNGITF